MAVQLEELQNAIEQFKRRISRFGGEISEMQADLNRVSELLAQARNGIIETEDKVVVIEEDLDEVRKKLAKPHSDEMVRRIAWAKKRAERIKKLPKEEQIARFRRNVAAIRADAIASGTTVNNGREAAADD